MILASDLNQEYAKYDRGVRLKNATIASLLVVVLVPFGAFLDWAVYPKLLLPFFLLRLACSATTAAAWLALQSRYQQQLYPYLIHAWYLIPTTAMALMIAWSEGAVSPYYAGLNLVILAVSVVMQTNLKESIFSIAAIFGLYLAACLLHGEISNFSAVISNLYFLTVTALIVLVGNHNYNRLRYQEFVLRHQLGESQRQLEENVLQLQELDEAKSRFFANISHELRTPLTLIAGPLEKLQKNPLLRREPEVSHLVEIMEANSLRLLRMINNLLDLVRVEGPRHDSVKSTVIIDEMLKGLLVSLEHVAYTKGVRLESDYEPLALSISIDQDKLEKIVLNLLLNAIKFTAADGIVSLSWDVSEGQLLLNVRDTGIGIARDDLPHIFDRFWQANTSSTRKFQGVGIGLALVKELAESMGGNVRVESQLEVGSTFHVTLPVAWVDSVNQDPASKTPAIKNMDGPADEWLVSLYRRADLFIESSSSQAPVNYVDLVRRRRPLVLIGEDQPDMAAFIAAQLRDDFEVLIAADGQYAIDMCRQYKPDLLVLDLMMPEKDGIEVCLALEDEVKAQGLPILILTARADDETKLKVLQNGATDFLTKPFSTTELQTRCKNLVALSLLSGRVVSQNQELRRSMEQIKESEVRMVQHAKMISLGRMSAGLIHEINNPMNFLMGAVRQLKKQCEKAKVNSVGETFDDIEQGLKRVVDLISNLRAFTHPNPQPFQPVPLLGCVQKSCRLTASITAANVTPNIQIPAEIKVPGDATQLSQVFINLIQNALDACDSKTSPREHPVITIEAEEEDGQVTVKITDNGQGIPPDIMDKIFDPFFTTKDVGCGMGLGLSICHTIVKSHHGRLDVESLPGRGTTIILSLPAFSQPEIKTSPLVEELHESPV